MQDLSSTSQSSSRSCFIARILRSRPSSVPRRRNESQHPLPACCSLSASGNDVLQACSLDLPLSAYVSPVTMLTAEPVSMTTHPLYNVSTIAIHISETFSFTSCVPVFGLSNSEVMLHVSACHKEQCCSWATCAATVVNLHTMCLCQVHVAAGSLFTVLLVQCKCNLHAA